MRVGRGRKAFTMLEIMFVVLIVGIIASLAVPSLLQARITSMRNTCLVNQVRIQAAKEQWGMANRKIETATPALVDLVPDYLKVFPSCPRNGTYTIGPINVRSDCSLPEHAP